ncbi:MAG: c-type cytochrome [Pseudomonadota bacterium]
MIRHRRRVNQNPITSAKGAIGMNMTRIFAIGFTIITAAGCGDNQVTEPPPLVNQTQRIGDAERGRHLFADKGCIICHSVNGVGGLSAPPLDALTEADVPDPVGFATRMWRGAPAMIELQGLELGYAIWIEPQEMVDLATFAASAAEQKKLTLESIDEGLAASFLDESFWGVEDWSDFLANGQEGAGEPFPDD